MNNESAIATFPLERPPRRGRRRGAVNETPALPYFVAGPENALIAYLCQSTESIFPMGNPILLTGPTGIGKTVIALHLAQRQATLSDAGDNAVLVLPAIDFGREYAEAVSSDDMVHFQSRINDAPVLLIDDLHFLADKPPAQDELSNRLETRTLAQRPTIVTCSRLPSEVRGLRQRLVSRVVPGLTVAMKPAEKATRHVLLREYALFHSLDIDDSLLDLLNQLLDDSVSGRSIESVIKQISLWCRMKESPPDESAIKQAIDSVSTDHQISLSAITNAVSRHFGHRAADVRGSSRRQQLVRSRSLAMYLARKLTSMSMQQIGDYFGGRDHTTVMHATRKIETALTSTEEDTELRRAHDLILEKL